MTSRPKVLALLALTLFVRTALAWWPPGHYLICESAVRILPADVPTFFPEGSAAIAAYAVDPDLWKSRDLPALRGAEGPEHYLDLELLRGETPPPAREEFRRLCERLHVEPDRAGMLPYAIQEGHDRLVVAFAAWRRWPNDPRTRARVLYLAGIVAHYTGDAGQPLHTTIHFDGRVGPGGASPRTGIHQKMDNLPAACRLTPEQVARALRVRAPEALFPHILDVIRLSNGRVDRVYQLEAALPAPEENQDYDAPARGTTEPGPRPGPGEVPPDVSAFALDCTRTAAQLTAEVWYSAWRRSEKVELPDWYRLYKAD